MKSWRSLREARLLQDAAEQDLHEAMLASAQLVDRLPAGALSEPVPRASVAALERVVVAAGRAGDEDRFAGSFTGDGRLTMISADPLRMELDRGELGFLLSPASRLRLEGEPAGNDEFVWSRYRAQDQDGVLVARLRDHRVSHLWLVLRTW